MFITPAYAQAASTAAAPDGLTGTLFFFGQFALVGLVFWFLVFRPQQARAKEQRAKLAAVKRGDSVVTAGGLIGKVTKVDEANVEVEIAPNVRVKVVKVTLADVVPAGTKAAND